MSLTFPKLGALAAFTANPPLSSTDLPSVASTLGFSGQLPSINIPDPAGGASLGSIVATLSNQTSVAVINSASDTEPTGFLDFGKPADNPTTAALVDYPLKFDPTLAYLVISGLNIGGKIAGKFTLGSDAAAALTANGSVDITNCIGFARATPSLDALTSSLGAFKTIFDVADILNLGPNAGAAPPTSCEVLSYGVATTLGLSFSLSSSAVAPVLANSLSSIFNMSGPISFSPTPSITLSVSVEADDGFRLFVQRVGGASLFEVRKAESTSLGLDAGAGLKIAISDSDLNSLVGSYFDQLTGAVAGTVQSLLIADPKAGLSNTQTTALQQLVSMLNLTNAAGNGLAQLQTEFATLKTDLIQRLTPSVTAQFSYSWKRITTTSKIVELTVPDAALPKYHTDLLSFDLARIMTAGVQNDGVIVGKLLGQTVTEIDLSYGFSFGIGSFTFIKSTDSLTEKFVENDSYDNSQSLLRQYAFLGKRSYAAQWITLSLKQSSLVNYTELDSSTAVPLASPSLSDFHTGLSISFTQSPSDLGDSGIAIADLGVLLNIFDTDDATVALGELTTAGLPNGVSGTATVVLTVPPSALTLVVPLIAANYSGNLASKAMARALPAHPPFIERINVTKRTNIYDPIMANFLTTDPGSLDQATISGSCSKPLWGTTTGLSNSEIAGIAAWTAAAIVNMSDRDSLQNDINNNVPLFLATLQLTTGDYRTIFPNCVSDISDLASQTYGARFLASLIVLGAYLQPGLLDQMPRTVKIEWTDTKNAKQSISLQQGSLR